MSESTQMTYYGYWITSDGTGNKGLIPSNNKRALSKILKTALRGNVSHGADGCYMVTDINGYTVAEGRIRRVGV